MRQHTRVDEYLIVAIAGRMLAASAKRGGYRAAVVDLFNDLDTRNDAARSRAVRGRDGGLGGFDAVALAAAVDEWFPIGDSASRPLSSAKEQAEPIDCAAIVYGSGFEDAPGLLRTIARGRRLIGNSAEVIETFKDPKVFFSLLDALDIPHPEVSFEAPKDLTGWLAKRTGGSGGAHVHAARSQQAWETDRYFQRFQPGDNYSVSFLANGNQARVIGFNEPWTVELGDWPYCYAGAINRVTPPAAIEGDIEAKLNTLVAATGLVGLNGMDFIVAEDRSYSVIEVNPRPPGTVDLYDPDWPDGLFHWHLRACKGELPDRLFTAETIRAHAVVYTRHGFALPAQFAFPKWCSDIPQVRTEFAPRMPVCMVHAEGKDHAAVKRLILERRTLMENLLLREAA